MARCLVVHPGALGDVLLARSALAHLGALGFRTTLAVSPRLVGLFQRSGLVDGARDLETLGLHRLFVAPADPATLDALAQFDAVVCWLGAGDPTFRSNLARLERPTVVARATPPAGAGRHVSRHLVESLAPLGALPSPGPLPRLGVAEADRAVARAWLAERGVRPGAVVLQPGAGSPTKVWPGFADLGRRLHAGRSPLIGLAGPGDTAVVEALVRAGVLSEAHVAREWPLPELAGLLSLARVLVGNDSGPTHLGAAVGCPTLAVFGPTDPELWGPIGAHVAVAAARPWPDVDRVDALLATLLGATDVEAPGDVVIAAGRPAWP